VHECAHALAGWSAGGVPTLVSSTDTQGDWSRLGERGVLWVGVSGSLANAVVSLAGWLLFRRGIGSPSASTVVPWLIFVVNAWMPTVYLVASPLLGFGDWSTVIAEFPNRGPLRASAVVTGLFLAAALWNGTCQTLARLVGNGAAVTRVHRAAVLTRTAWACGGAAAVLASLFSPLSLVSAVPIAVGSTLGTAWPMVAAATSVAKIPVPGTPLEVRRSWPVLFVGSMAGLVLVFVFGPGIDLTR